MDLKKKVLKKEEIEYLGNLAKIGLTEDEKAQFAEELDKIIYYISQLSEVPTEKVSPVWHNILILKNLLRNWIKSWRWFP